MSDARVLDIASLSVNFPGKGRLLRAVRDLSLALPKAAITCLVGESGCGKSLTCRAILRLTPENAMLGGQIFFQGVNLLDLPEKQLRQIRGARIGMIFQEPMTSLNPVLCVGQQTAEPLRLHLGMSKKEARAEVERLFAQVGIPSPASRYSDYPHQLSGGMRQRVMIAMALSCRPALLLADEPVTALDATIQGQILRLILGQSRARSMAVLMITHDLGVVADVGDYVGVMYAGMMVEYASARELFTNPLHPYTKGLMASAPGKAAIHMDRLPAIPGTVPTLENMPPGCPFQPRCEYALPACAQESPVSKNFDGHRVSCWLFSGGQSPQPD